MSGSSDAAGPGRSSATARTQRRAMDGAGLGARMRERRGRDAAPTPVAPRQGCRGAVSAGFCRVRHLGASDGHGEPGIIEGARVTVKAHVSGCRSLRGLSGACRERRQPDVSAP